MYHLLKKMTFQLAMLVYWRVSFRITILTQKNLQKFSSQSYWRRPHPRYTRKSYAHSRYIYLYLEDPEAKKKASSPCSRNFRLHQKLTTAVGMKQLHLGRNASDDLVQNNWEIDNYTSLIWQQSPQPEYLKPRIIHHKFGLGDVNLLFPSSFFLHSLSAFHKSVIFTTSLSRALCDVGKTTHVTLKSTSGSLETR